VHGAEQRAHPGAARAGLVLRLAMAGRARARAHAAWVSVGQDEVPIDKLYVLQQHAEGWDLGWPHMELQAASLDEKKMHSQGNIAMQV
jgi:hypothetical protein